MKRATERWMAVGVGGLIAAFVAAGEPEPKGTDVLARPAAAFLLMSHEVALPASLHQQAWRFTPRFSNDVWSRFERDHVVGPDSGPFADTFYGFCVSVQQFKLLEKDINAGFDRFDASITDAMFGLDEADSARSRSGKASDGFFGRPHFQTVTPLSDGGLGSTSYVKGRDNFGRLQGHEGQRMTLGVQIVIPFGH